MPAGDVEVAVWGPFATTLQDSVGETIGVVQGRGLAFGLQVLNPKTLGGFPNTEDDIEPDYSFARGSGEEPESYRGDTARPTPFGSVVQAYTRNRSKSRVISNWGHAYYTAPAYKDGGLTGSSIAVFGCQSAHALGTIGEIEVAEGLPHPLIDGIWGKVSPTARESYLVMPFDTKNLDACISFTKAAGMRYLYSDSCFETWGHFKLKTAEFPHNWTSMKECVDRAKAQGVRLGVHTLSNFITPSDAYVTPRPDQRLAEVGSSALAAGLSANEQQVVIRDPRFFNEMANNTLRTVRIGDELIQYESVSSVAPWRLLNCKRGAFGTIASHHRAGARVAKLMDHGYGTFLTNADLGAEVAQNISDLFNQTGLEQLSLDGLEGNWSTGMGQYGRTLFTRAWFDHLAAQLKGQVINDASNPGTFNWHIYTRMNWGEPWYAGFRKSQTEYRLKNQRYFRRNLMPGMLGWFQLQPETTLEDIQWLLARAAGFDAGFCVTASLDSMLENPQREDILAAIKTWESARHAHAFPTDLVSALRDTAREFELTQTAPGKWSLVEFSSRKFTLHSGRFETSFEAPANGSEAKLIQRIPKVPSVQWTVEVDGKLRGTFSAMECPGLDTVDLSCITPGTHKLVYQLEITGDKDAALDVELRTPISSPRALVAQP